MEAVTSFDFLKYVGIWSSECTTSRTRIERKAGVGSLPYSMNVPKDFGRMDAPILATSRIQRPK
jgi:hypothetical protein